MRNIIKVLYYIDHPEVAILEVENTDVENSIFWLIYYKSTAQVKRFAFSAFSAPHRYKQHEEKGILKKVKSFRKFWIEIDNRILAFRHARPELLSENVIENIDRQYSKLIGW
jgi:hypothetical protein